MEIKLDSGRKLNVKKNISLDGRDDLLDSIGYEFDEKGTKAAGARARKAIGEIKKKVTGYRKASISESKL